MRSLHSRIALVFAWIVAIAIILWLLFAYSAAVSNRLYDEAKQNFSEVYQQVDSNFLTFMEDAWKNLGDWGPYIHDLGDADSVAYIEDRRSVWGFSRFLFLSQNGEAITLNGEIIHFDLGEDNDVLFQQGSPIMTEQGIESIDSETVFASPVIPGIFEGFPYQAIAIAYNNEDLANTIRTDAFSGQSIGFVVFPDGTIAFSTQEGGNVYSNYLTYLAAGSSLSQEQLEDLRSAWEAGERGVQICSLHDEEYYIAYQPLGYGDYMLLGVVPSDAVGGAIRGIQEMTVDVLLKVFLIVMLVSALQIFFYMRRRQKKSNAEIQYRDVLFNLLSANLDDIFVVMDANTHKVNYITPNVNRLLGVTPEAAKENLKTLTDCLANDRHPINMQQFSKLKAGERSELTQEWINREDGTHHWFREAVYRLDIQDKEQFIFILSDRTEDRRMAQSLEEALVTAKNASASKSQFLSSMSHDIRTPMNSIMGFTELLDVYAEDPKRVRDYIRKISASSRHLLNLINDVLDMSKIESGKTELNVEEFSFEDLLEEVCTIMAPQAQAKDQSFQMRVEGELADCLLGDKLRINQILINLLSNAVKYTPAGGNIEFIVKELPSKKPNYDNVRFIVKDDGIGMSEDYLEVIFDPFTRETSSLTNTVQGTGLGMAITKNLVDLMGGGIGVESKQGEGTTFTLDLAFAVVGSDDESHQRKLAQKEKADPDALRGLSILAAEDNELSAEMLIERLEMEGAKVQRVRNGQEAVETFEASEPGRYDIILMDVQMPVMGGHDATRAIRNGSHPEAKTIPIFAMTADVFVEDVRASAEAGMNAHIPKPVDMDELKIAAARELRKKEQLDD